MIAVITLVYVTAVWLIFAKLKLARPTPVPIAAAVLVGILLIGGIVICWQFAAPMSPRVVVTQYVVQIVPRVTGQVKEIVARPNVAIKKGDVLFHIDPAPFQYRVNQLTAQLAATRTQVKQAEFGLEAARAAVKKGQEQEILAKTEWDMAVKTYELNKGAISELKKVQTQQSYEVAKASVRQLLAAEQQATFAIPVASQTAKSLEAQLADAEYDLEYCTVRAPADGYVTNWAIREGSRVASLPLSPAGAFIETSENSVVIVLPQNLASNVREGNKVELAMKPYPGDILDGEVESILDYSGEGQMAVGGNLPDFSKVGSGGMMGLKVRMVGDSANVRLDLGNAGSAAIYTDSGKAFQIISRVTVRINSFMNYLPF